MQRYSQADRLLFTADQRSKAFSGLMLPEEVVAALEGFGQGHLAVPLQFPEVWPEPRPLLVPSNRWTERGALQPTSKSCGIL